MSNFDEFLSDLSLSHLRFVWFEKSHNMLSLQEGEGTVACNQSPGTTPRNHTTSLRHHTTPLLQPQKLSNQTHQEEWHYTCLYLCLFIYLFVLNEIFPIVSFLVWKLFSGPCMLADHYWPKMVSHYLGLTFQKQLSAKRFSWNVETTSAEGWA